MESLLPTEVPTEEPTLEPLNQLTDTVVSPTSGILSQIGGENSHGRVTDADRRAAALRAAEARGVMKEQLLASGDLSAMDAPEPSPEIPTLAGIGLVAQFGVVPK